MRFLDMVAAKAQFAKLHLANHDLLVLPDAAMRDRDARPRLATNILAAPVFGRERIGDAQLDLLAHAIIGERCDGLAFAVAGEKFSRRDFALWLSRALTARNALFSPAPTRPAWFIAVDEKFWCGLPRFNYHDAAGRERREEREGSLPAVIAAAMVFVAKPGAAEVIFDPTMGSGTILAEAVQMARGAVLSGYDADPAALAAARKNIASGTVRLARRNSSREPAPGGVTFTIANLPFGEKFASPGGNRAFYSDVLRRSLERAAEGWRAVLLTSDQDALVQAVRENGLSVKVSYRVRVRGKPAAIHLVERSY
ncbi:MAG: hypothetical protein JOZ55_04065 [Alphaproteobacteria bacterium]|nr:hypothetical protein [Alphaproteobacteria bacterium]